MSDLDRHLLPYAVLETVADSGRGKRMTLPWHPDGDEDIVADYSRFNEHLSGTYDTDTLADVVDDLVEESFLERQPEPRAYSSLDDLPERYAANLRITEEGCDELERAWSKHD